MSISARLFLAGAVSAAALLAADNATISGKIVFKGAKPVMRPLTMDATPACAKQHAKPMLSEEAVIAADGSLQNVFIYVKAGLPAKTWPVTAQAVTVDQLGCVYRPHVIGVMAGQDVKFTNNDPTSHNVHPLPKVNNEWNQSQAPKGEAIVRKFTKPEIGLLVKCNLHPWMRVYVNVVENPFHAVSGADGTFTISGLPAGDYTLAAWHERFGTQEIKVKVPAGGKASANFNFK
ncbi:MAG: carboxypeptidase regulatory-like domain-containing protein [Bryobacterales bacterium]|nr:carboxypeptidase regulatory-like domain-containing protein [Bryobacterales bacterium]